MHARIEQHCSKKDVFTQDQWCQLISDSKTTNKYKVNQIGQEDIYNFDELATFFIWKNLRISSLKEIVVSRGQCQVVIKYDFSEPEKKLI